jgi:hypothetical protein
MPPANWLWDTRRCLGETLADGAVLCYRPVLEAKPVARTGPALSAETEQRVWWVNDLDQRQTPSRLVAPRRGCHQAPLLLLAVGSRSLLASPTQDSSGLERAICA